MAQTNLFLSNGSQAVRLPKDVAFLENLKEVTILRDGGRRIIVPANSAWDDCFAHPALTLASANNCLVRRAIYCNAAIYIRYKSLHACAERATSKPSRTVHSCGD